MLSLICPFPLQGKNIHNHTRGSASSKCFIGLLLIQHPSILGSIQIRSWAGPTLATQPPILAKSPRIFVTEKRNSGPKAWVSMQPLTATAGAQPTIRQHFPPSLSLIIKHITTTIKGQIRDFIKHKIKAQWQITSSKVKTRKNYLLSCTVNSNYLQIHQLQSKQLLICLQHLQDSP